MKKIALLLAVLLVLGLFAGCNAEEERTPDHVVPGYAINLYTGEGWTAAEESEYDLQLSKDGVTVYVMGFTVMDFVDMPSYEELYLECNEELFEDMTEVSVKEKETTYEKNGNKIISSLFSAKSEDKTSQYYCFGISFTDEAESVAWVCFEAAEKTMKKQKNNLKALVEDMDANGKYVSPEEMEEEIQEALGEDYDDGEEGDVVEDDATPTDAVEEVIPTGEGSAVEENPETTDPVIDEDKISEEATPDNGKAEETKPEETKPAEGEEETKPEETKPEETTEDTKPAQEQTATDATEAVETTTAATEATKAAE